MSATGGCAVNTGDEPPCITSPLKSYPRESTAQNREGETELVNPINGSGDASIGFGSPRKSENERPLSRSPRRRSPKRRSRSRSPKRRSRSRSPVSRAKICDEIDDWEKNECVILDNYNCDLNMIINSSNYGAKPQTDGGFSMMWAGVRASYGFVEGKIFYEVRIVENIAVDNLDSLSGGATHVVRVGWSTEDSLFALGEEHNSFGYGGTGKKSCDNKFADYGCTFSEGDVVGAFLEITVNEAIMRFSVNGVDQGECYRVNKASLSTKKALFPHVYVKNVEFSVNFGHDDAEPWFAPNIPGDDSATWHQLNQTALNTRVRGRLPPSSKAECDVIMMIGLPGAGKTYYADKLSNENKDKQYNILGTNFILDRMKVIGLARQRNYAGRWDVLIDKATMCLNVLMNIASYRRRNYILDQTNVYPSAQRRKMRPFEGYKRRAIVIVPTDEEFRRRIAQREKEEGKEVPESAVLEMKANFGIPKAISEDSTSVFDEVEFTELGDSAASSLVEQYNEEGQAGRPPQEKRQRWESRDRDSGDSRWSGGGGGGFDRDRSRDFSRGRRDGFNRSPRRDDRGRRDYRGAPRDGREDRFDRGRDRDSYGRGRFGGSGGGGAPSGRFGGPPPPRGGGYAPNMRGGGYGGGFDGGMSRGGMNRGGGNYGYGYDMNRGPPGDFRGGPRGGRGGYHGGGGSVDPIYRGGPPSYGGSGGANDPSYEGSTYPGYPSNSSRGGPMDSQTSGRGTAPPPSRGMGAPGRGAPPVGRGGGVGPGGSRGSQDPYGGVAGGYPSSAVNYPPGGRSQFPGMGESYTGGNQQKPSGGGGYPARTSYSEGGYQKGAYPDEYASASASCFSSAGGYAEAAYPPGTNPPSSYPPQESYSNAGGMRGGRAAPIPPSGMYGGAGEPVEGAKPVRSSGQSAESQAVEGINQHTSSASRFGGDRQGGGRQSRFDDAKAPSAQNMYQQQNPYSYPSSGYQSAYNAGGYGSSSVTPPGKGAAPANQPPPSKSNRGQYEQVPPTVNPGPHSQQSMGYGYGYQQSKPESTNQAPAKQAQSSGGANSTSNYNSAYGYGYTYGGYGAAAPTGASQTPPSAASTNAAGSASLYASAVADKTTKAQSMSGSSAAQKQAAAPSGAASATSMAYASYYGYGQPGVQPSHSSAGAQAVQQQQQQQQQQQYSAWQQSTGNTTAAAPAAASTVPTTTSPAGGQAAAAAASAYSNYYAAYPGYASAAAYGRPSGGSAAGSTASAQQQSQQPPPQQQQQQQYYAGYR